MSFDMSDSENVDNMVDQLIDINYVNRSPDPVRQVSWYFLQCVNARLNWTNMVKDGAVVMNAIKRVAEGDPRSLQETRFPFYMLYQTETVLAFPDSVGLGYLFGEGAPNLVTPFVDTNWKDPHGWNGYTYFIDQPTTLLPYSYHVKAWDFFQRQLFQRIVSTMSLLAKTQNIKLDFPTLLSDAKAIVEFDHLLATTYSTDDTTRRHYDRSYNPMTIDKLSKTYSNISWTTFVSMVRLSLSFVVFLGLHKRPLHLNILPALTVNQSRKQFQIYVDLIDLRLTLFPEKRKYERRQHDDTREAQESCAMETYANARVFIDKIYPTNESRIQLREHVAKMVSSILIGFRTMIDQLNWMTSATKKGAYSKIDNLVRNIAYPDWITDDAQFTSYYKVRFIGNIKILCFLLSWNLLVAGSTKRQDFNGPPGTTNAWYQPQLNSITFPAAILHQPFYDPTWPTAVNFGGLGVIAGHELTHGFDDEGVQWDGTGVLRGWMDDASKTSFDSMAHCVVKEYDEFCPLNKTAYGTAACLDGAQTQGENIADNGGIHAAYRAYRNFINLYGPDPQLPDEVLQEFTSEQLFFLSFARVWCQQPSPDQSLELQILLDPHSPAKYRVFGTIQNFAAFKDAFHCPSSAYAPDKHCDVWVSDIDSSCGQPVVRSELNIQMNEQITTSDIDKYNAYKEAVSFYQPSVNTSADPCNDFWQYACGNYNKSVSFHFADAHNLKIMAEQLNSPSYQSTIKASTALTKEKAFSDACIAATRNSSAEHSILVSNNYFSVKVKQLAMYLGSNFTYAFGGEVGNLPNSTQVANALSYLSFNQNIATLVTPYVDTNWIDPAEGYRMFLDQNTAFLSKTYYVPNAFKTIEDNYVKSTTAVIELHYSTDDTTRRMYARSWNMMSIGDLQDKFNFVDWKTYFSQVRPNLLERPTNVVLPYIAIRSHSCRYHKFSKIFLFCKRCLLQEDLLVLGRKRSGFRFSHTAGTLADTQADCAGMANTLMQFANGRVFIDYLYPDDNSRTAGGVISNVIHSFQGMIDQLDWMSIETKKKAYNKTANIVKNIAFPDWITDNKKLDAYYHDLTFDTSKNYYDIKLCAFRFNIELQYKQLTAVATDRHDFLGQPGTVNAWYQPELNSITFPAGILQPPYFHPKWPASINYGGMGLVAGHELTHGFDDEGVQWGPEGSTAGFNLMAHCIIDEYSKFCPIDPTKYSPNCINGAQTQGENIADNGGVHAAFRAYRTHIALDGPDPLLPDRLFGQFTHDQLFFLSFAQVWCERERTDDQLYKQLMVDPHSPARYRVFGTIQNYPAFRAAYNCPVNSVYSPAHHCSVWVPTVKP
ncbi:unnamed protein product [Angiostrongylus costaricensis]|uniref:Neprilysin n=1 Tax=Angiostrongylus costaricensis TaxID=334426 RepID=A0A0R3PN13_ANGCS|nr:unnamed protein product [Angiostrongylus costaricensis]